MDWLGKLFPPKKKDDDDSKAAVQSPEGKRAAPIGDAAVASSEAFLAVGMSLLLQGLPHVMRRKILTGELYYLGAQRTLESTILEDTPRVWDKVMPKVALQMRSNSPPDWALSEAQSVIITAGTAAAVIETRRGHVGGIAYSFLVAALYYAAPEPATPLVRSIYEDYYGRPPWDNAGAYKAERLDLAGRIANAAFPDYPLKERLIDELQFALGDSDIGKKALSHFMPPELCKRVEATMPAILPPEPDPAWL